MSENLDEALRRQAFPWVMSLTPAGYGIYPGCMQKKLVFAPRRATPGTGKERCLDCWRAER